MPRMRGMLGGQNPPDKKNHELSDRPKGCLLCDEGASANAAELRGSLVRLASFARDRQPSRSIRLFLLRLALRKVTRCLSLLTYYIVIVFLSARVTVKAFMEGQATRKGWNPGTPSHLLFLLQTDISLTVL